MRGEELREVFVGFGGFDGDRRFAFRSAAARPEFPYFTAREQAQMLRYRPRLSAAGAGVYVDTPDGETLAIDDPALIAQLGRDVDPNHELSLMRGDSALADAFPVSMISVQTARAVAQETHTVADKRRFRANIYIDLPGSDGFAENEFVGRTLAIGAELLVDIVKRDTRCTIISLDPDTATREPAILKAIAQAHGGTAGVYARVRREGRVRTGDAVKFAA